MKSRHQCLITRRSVLAVHCALVAMALGAAAHAADTEDPALAELTRPTSSVELGIGNVSRSSAKFGEYNGLGRKGPFGIGELDLHGGGAWDSDDATRWNLRGSNLGLETRDLSADYGVQGKFRLNFGYGELLHRLSDTYQTPFNGTGSRNLSLPGSWLKPIVPQINANLNFRALSPTASSGNSLVAGVTTAPTPAQLATMQTIRDADLPAFHNFDLKTKRQTYDAGFGYNFGPQLELTASFRHELKNGTKPIGAISTKGNESVVILPDPIDTSTDHYNLGLNYTGDKGFMVAGYHGSIFRNNVKSVTWQEPSLPSTAAAFSTQSSAPSNQFHQLSLTGGYNITPTTKLVANGSYGRNTQNDAFLTDPATPPFASQLPLGVPRSSLDGLVITKAFNAKLTTRPVKGLNLAAGYKFDDRDNRTPVDRYVFYDVNVPPAATPSVFNAALGLPAGTLANNSNIYNNRPQSKRLNQINLDGDYAVAKGHTLAAGYELQHIDRHCNGTWIDCSDARTTKENTLRTEWRARLTEDLSGKLGYAFSRRTVDYNTNSFLALVPMANVVPSTAPAGVTSSAYQYLLQNGLSGYGPFGGFVPTASQTPTAAFYTPNNNIAVAPTFYSLYGSRNNVSELPGMRRFFLADRDRDKFRSSLNWEATDRLSLYGGVDYNQDNYRNSPLGLQNEKGWAFNLDSAYALSDAFHVGLFYTYEDQRSKQASFIANSSNVAPPTTNSPIQGAVPGCAQDLAQLNAQKRIEPCNNWTADTRDKAHTFGLTARHKGLLSGKLDLGGSLIYSRARTDIGVRGGAYVADPTSTLAGANTPQIFIPATGLPTINTNSIELRLSGQYALDKASTVRMLYAYKRFTSTDFAYDGMQPGTLTGVMPSYEQAPQYTVHVAGISYVHTLR